jgi:5-methylcytosine-specific restriction endonuclease McrA
MADCLLYWKYFRTDFERDPTSLNCEWNSGNRNLLTYVNKGDTLWVVVSGGTDYPGEWRLLQQIVVMDVKDDAKAQRAGRFRYHAIGDPSRSPIYCFDLQGDLTPVLRKLQFTGGKPIQQEGALIGRALQSIRRLTPADASRLQKHAKTLPLFDPSTLLPDADAIATDDHNTLAPTKKKASTVLRVIRDSVVGKALKRKYDYKCQVCGATIKLPDGKRYAEVHHLRPVGKRHNGPDGWPNSIVVCPTHHAMFDLGLLAIHPKDLTLRHWDPNAREHRQPLRRSLHRLDLKSVKYQYHKLFRHHGKQI